MKTLLKTSTSSSTTSAAGATTTKTTLKYKWYCLLPESIGRHKRMALNVEKTSSALPMKTKSSHSKVSTQTNGFVVNVDINDRDEIQFSSGFPCTISEVKSTSGVSAPMSRPMPGDVLLQVNNVNVSRTQGKAVKKLLKSLPLPINLQLYRRTIPSTNNQIDKIVLNSVDQHQPLNANMFVSDKESCKTTFIPIEKLSSDDFFPKKSNRRTTEIYSSLLMSPINRQTCEQSDESESGVGSESNPYSDGDEENRLKTLSESYEREALHLIRIEQEFIRQIELGVQLYSRPLKHYLISSSEHAKLFQNIEKILAISKYQMNRLQTLSEETIVNHLGKIFHERVQLICEAFTRYMSGYADACQQLKQLSKCASFQRFIQNGNQQLSIEQFLQTPLNHIDNLAQQLDILCCTCDNANDANYLLHVLKELRQCSLHLSSIESSTSQNHCTTTMSLNSATGMSSLINQSEDQDILDLQNRLQSHPQLNLTGRNRHLIFSGTLLFQNEQKVYVETWAILLNDMLLLTERNAFDSRLNLVCDPIRLNEIVDFRSSDEREDALIFLSKKPNLPYKLRYPNKCFQYAWQTILEQRLKTWQRSIHDDSSSADSDLE